MKTFPVYKRGRYLFIELPELLVIDQDKGTAVLFSGGVSMTDAVEQAVNVTKPPAEAPEPVSPAKAWRKNKRGPRSYGPTQRVLALLESEGHLSTGEIAEKLDLDRDVVNKSMVNLVNSGKAHATGFRRRNADGGRSMTVWSAGKAESGSGRAVKIEGQTRKAIPKVLALMRDGSTYRTNEVAQMLDISRGGAFNALSALHKEGRIEKAVVKDASGSICLWSVTKPDETQRAS